MAEYPPVIAPNHLPTRPPVAFALAVILALYVWSAPGWLWGVILGALVVVVLATLVVAVAEPTLYVTPDGRLRPR